VHHGVISSLQPTVSNGGQISVQSGAEEMLSVRDSKCSTVKQYNVIFIEI
jgi:hypothetical protein